MRRWTGWFLLTLAMLLGASLEAGAPADKPAAGKPSKLETPANVTCSKSADTLIVTWEAVTGAAFYRVMLEADEEQALTENIEGPPYTQALSAITDDPTAPATVQVRAMRTPQGKGASKPSAEVPCLASTQ